MFKKLARLLKKAGITPEKSLIPNYTRALDWIKKNTIPGQGIAVTSKQNIPYPEVTGYLIPTLLDAGENDLAEQYADYLAAVQHPNGALAGPDGREYFFDTGQALRGFLRASQSWFRFQTCALKAADYIIDATGRDGRIPLVNRTDISENIHVYTLPVLAEAGRVLDKPEYIETTKKSLRYYQHAADILSPNRLTHFLAYILDGFMDMGESEFVRGTVKEIFATQRSNGSIPAYPDSHWVCSTGLAQLAIIGYKLGLSKEADRVVDYLCRIQNDTGGFYGSYGWGAGYFRNEEIGWANKFFVDAVHLKIAKSFDVNAKLFPIAIGADDGRLKAVLEHLGDLSGKIILDAGCGKGRFAAELKNQFPTVILHGVDISAELLNEAPGWLLKKKGTILNLPYEDRMFDAVICVEALEHVIQTEKAVSELCRVVKDNGRIIIIDKNREKRGALEITDLEQWFGREQIRNLLDLYCRDVAIKEIAYDNHVADGLFFAWTGVK
jgi:malonyl-CoA O-methyltransferase